MINIPAAYRTASPEYRQATIPASCHPVCADSGEACVGVVLLINKNNGRPSRSRTKNCWRHSIVGEILKRLTMSTPQDVMDDDEGLDADLVRPSEEVTADAGADGDERR